MTSTQNDPSRTTIGETIDQVARPHDGVATVHELAASGLTRHQVGSLVGRGLLASVHPGVYRTAGTVMTVRRDLAAACLSLDGLVAASHRAGLWLWGLYDEPPPIEITVQANCSPIRRRVIIHRSRDLMADHVTARRGIPVTKPGRCLVDAGCVVPPRVFDTALERALHRRLVSVRGLRNISDEVAGRGRNGVGILRKALDERALGDARPESMLEPLMARLCARNNIAGVRYQQELILDGRRLRPDFLIPDAKLVIEVDGLAVHGTRDALDHDLERQNLLAAHGYQVMRYTVTHLRNPDKIAAQVLATAARRRAELGGAQRNL